MAGLAVSLVSLLPGVRIMGLELSTVQNALLLLLALPYGIYHGVRRVNPLIVAYVLITAWSYVLSGWHPVLTALQPLKSLMLYLLPLILFELRLTPRLRRRLLWLLIVLPSLSLLLGAALALANVWSLYGDIASVPRLQGALIPPHFAMVCVAGVMAALYRGRGGEWGAVGWALWNLFLLLQTVTRGATLATMVIFAGYVLYRLRATGQVRRLASVGVLVALGLVLGGLAAPTFLQRNNDIIGFGVVSFDAVINTSGRVTAWRFFIEQASAAPVWGLGLGAGTVVNQGQVARAFRVPHNEYLRFFVDGGAVGVIVMLVAYGVFFWRVGRAQAVPWLYVSFVAGFAIYSVFDNTLSTPQFSVLFWLLLNIMLGDANGAHDAVPRVDDD